MLRNRQFAVQIPQIETKLILDSLRSRFSVFMLHITVIVRSEHEDDPSAAGGSKTPVALK